MIKWFIPFVVFFLGPLTCTATDLEIEPADEPVVEEPCEDPLARVAE